MGSSILHPQPLLKFEDSTKKIFENIQKNQTTNFSEENTVQFPSEYSERSTNFNEFAFNSNTTSFVQVSKILINTFMVEIIYCIYISELLTTINILSTYI